MCGSMLHPPKFACASIKGKVSVWQDPYPALTTDIKDKHG